MFCFCYFRAFSPILHFKLLVFVGGDVRIFLSPGVRYPSYATAYYCCDCICIATKINVLIMKFSLGYSNTNFKNLFTFFALPFMLLAYKNKLN